MYHAPDVQDFLAAWEAVAPVSTDRVSCGAGCCMLAMAFAGESVLVVQKQIVRLSVAGETWSPGAVRALIEDLEALSPQDQGKRDGRASQFMGVHFLRGLVASADTWNQVQGVFSEVGDMVLADDPPQLLHMLSRVCELPRVGKYFGVRIARLVSLARESAGKALIPVGHEEWPILSTMGGGPLQGFRDLDVRTFEEAERMVAVIRRFFGGCDASHKNRRFSLMHLPCVVCEWHGLLQKVGSASQLLSRIPASKECQLKMHKQLTSGHWHSKFHSSYDRAASKKQGFEWWQRSPDLLADSALSAFHGKNLDCGPRVECSLCRNILPLNRWAGKCRPATRCHRKGPCDASEALVLAPRVDAGVAAIARECGVCLEPLSGVELWAKVSSCEHEYHAECISQWANQQNTCPCCRRRFLEIVVLDTDGTPVTTVEVEDRTQRADTVNDADVAAELSRELNRSRSRSSRR